MIIVPTTLYVQWYVSVEFFGASSVSYDDVALTWDLRQNLKVYLFVKFVKFVKFTCTVITSHVLKRGIGFHPFQATQFQVVYM